LTKILFGLMSKWAIRDVLCMW